MPVLDLFAAPSRLAVARRLAEAPGSSAPELAAATGLHLNTVRGHLQALEGAGALQRIAESHGLQGRPVVRYRLRREFTPPGDEMLPLSGLLAEALIDVDPDHASVRTAGLEWGRRWARRQRAPVEERLRTALERLGFGVKLERGALTLNDCPCSLVSPRRPRVVCDLADAVIDGVLEGSTSRAKHKAHPPRARRCKATLTAA